MLSPTLRGLCLVLFCAVAASGLALAEPQGRPKERPKGKLSDLDGKDDKPGRARWEWTLGGGKGKKAEKGTFRGYLSGEIYHSEKQIGTYTIESKKRVKADFKEGPLKGTAELHVTRAKPATFEGELVRHNGKKEKLVLVIIDD
jgi:hypothetical protein